jgi:SAM-dependent methyltransferase
MTHLERSMKDHYAGRNLTERLLAALGLSADDRVTVETLSPVDQLHHGGIALTERLIALADIAPGQRVLDAGSGIGGAARVLAHRFGCWVEAIDISPDYVRTAAELDHLVGLSDRIVHRIGSVTALPFEDCAFDLVWSQNVSMNVQDKDAMFAEAFRVLKPGGTFALTHVAAGSGEPPDFPLPWARTPETSFLSTPKEIIEAVTVFGFRDAIDHANGAPLSPLHKAAAEGPDDSIAMGEDMPLRKANAARAVADGRLIPMMVIARRP